MNSKLVNVFAVCLITLAVLFPSLIMFGVVWEKHIEFVEHQQNISTPRQNMNTECSALMLQINSPRKEDCSKLYLNSSETNIKISDGYKINHSRRWLFLFMPFFPILVIYLYDRYLVYRAKLFQKQVEMLEKLWQQSFEK
ncbi:MAG: hypothetical protein ACFB2X_19990 [Rivularia sp. (in: cyanobacteria)]